MTTVNRALLGRNIAIGAEALRAHPLRSALTTSGVVFGVGAVICMLAIGKGAETRALGEYRRLGIHNLHVEARPAVGRAAVSGLIAADAAALVIELAPHIEAATVARVADHKVWARAQSADATVTGVTPAYAAILATEMTAGRFVSDLDAATGAAVCVLSTPIALALFPARPAVGEFVRVAGRALRVVGVVRTAALANGKPPLFVPLATAASLPPGGHDPGAVQRLVLQLAPGADPVLFGAVVERALLRRHAGADDFAVIVPSELIRKAQRTQRIFQIVMGSIAGISLLVGGIGIANILFASVVERTSEIGLRRAVGARRADIVAQFVFEAAAIGIAGGIAGIMLGVAGTFIVARAAHWPVLVTPGGILLAAGTALATGLVSGSAPARRAATVDAIVALRHE